MIKAHSKVQKQITNHISTKLGPPASLFVLVNVTSLVQLNTEPHRILWFHFTNTKKHWTASHCFTSQIRINTGLRRIASLHKYE